MSAHRPLQPEVEAALQTLETSQDYTAGTAAVRIVKAALRRFSMYEALIIVCSMVPLGLALSVRDIIPLGWALIATVAAIAFGLGTDWLLDRSSHRRRLQAALNRWRQIAGTLAVTKTLP
ncbi:MAG: hypothetical protein ACOYKM_04575 [Caulobacterales bacterium]